MNLSTAYRSIFFIMNAAFSFWEGGGAVESIGLRGDMSYS